MVFQNEILAGSSGSSASSVYSIDQSIRFNDDDSGRMGRTPSSVGNRKTWTFSVWIKRGNLDSSGFKFIFSRTEASKAANIAFYQDSLYFSAASAGHELNLTTNRKFRDASAFYHIIIAQDTTQAIASERVRFYINGQRETSFSTETYPALNYQGYINTTALHDIGVSRPSGSLSGYFDGYMSEINFLDGYAYDPSYFGETNVNGIWIPKEYSGSYGTNGFYIKGADASSLGTDSSGNGNNFTTSGLASHDQMADTPTNNFATINSIYADNAPAGNAGTLSNGNLQYVGGGSTFDVKGLTFNLPKSGKWYFEYMIGGTNDGFGFIKQGEQGSINAGNGPGNVSVAQGGGIQYSGWRNDGVFTTNFGSTFTAGHIHQVAIDVDNGKFFYGIQNTYYATDAGTDGNPSAGTNELSTFAFSTTDVVLLAGNYSGTQYWNFGQDGTFAGQQTAQGNSDANGVGNFYYAPPTGYLALCTKNLGS